MYFLVNMKFWYFKFLKQFIRSNFFSATLPSKHSCEFCFIRLDLIGATQLMTPITLLNEVRISDINIFKIRVVWKIYLIQGFFINVSRIIFKWTASNLLVRSSFNSGDFSTAVNKLVITDSPTSMTPSCEILSRKLASMCDQYWLNQNINTKNCTEFMVFLISLGIDWLWNGFFWKIDELLR